MIAATGSMDFETFSPAGFVWNEATQKFQPLPGARFGPTKGLGVVGAARYTEHPGAEVLCLSYRLPGGPIRRWKPGDPNPQDLFDFMAAGGIVKAFNAMFEFLVWKNICERLYGWPPIEPWRYQFRCTMATARANQLPGKLDDLAKVLKLSNLKDAAGKALLNLFSVPQNPTKKQPARRVYPHERPDEFGRLQTYCDGDVAAEDEAASKIEPMTDAELLFWWIDQEINYRGVAIDRPAIRNCIAILNQALSHYGDECRAITGFDPTQLAELRGWLAARGVYLDKMDAETLEEFIPRMAPHPPGGMDPRRRVLEIRELIGSASVKKLYAMENQGCADDRLRNLIIHHGARTGRPTGEGPQPLNLPRGGPEVMWCGQSADGKSWAPDACRRPFRPTLDACPWCCRSAAGLKKRKWSAAAVDYALEIIAHRSLELVEWFFGDALGVISGCLRGLFVAGPGKELIASDFTAIEAVVTAMLSGCQWRIDTFRRREDIYLHSAAKITGRTAEEYAAYKAANDDHHPDRQKIGKVAELALGFMGWIAAWLNFDKSGTFSEDQIKNNILAWREASPEIVELAGGQTRRERIEGRNYARPECFGFEGAAVQAIQNPGQVYTVAGIHFQVVNDCLRVTLLSGRVMKYWFPRLTKATRDWAQAWELSITYWTWNTNTKYGMMGWVIMSTYAGKLIENIVQAVAHDILRFAITNLRAAGYPCVLHVYDEIVVEVPIGTGSIEEVERIMGLMPAWAQGWPIFANGGWRGYRYRKG